MEVGVWSMEYRYGVHSEVMEYRYGVWSMEVMEFTLKYRYGVWKKPFYRCA